MALMKLKVAELEVHPFNLKVYGEPDDGLKESLATWGQRTPIVVDENGAILSGARRWAAAIALDWVNIDGIERQFDSDEEAELEVLLANKYRGVKLGTLRKREADEYLRLIRDSDDPEKTKSTILESLSRNNLREDVQTVGTAHEQKPVVVAAHAAGMSHTTYNAYNYWLDDGGLTRIQKAREKSEISESQARSLTASFAAMRRKVARDERGPERPMNALRRAVTDAKRTHSETGEETQRREITEALVASIAAGKAFVRSLYVLSKISKPQYLEPRQALVLGGQLKEAEGLILSIGREVNLIEHAEPEEAEYVIVG
jgi:hypothetical protein